MRSFAAILVILTTTVSGQERNVFGEKSLSEAALMGIFYDLKQDQDGKPSRNWDYWPVLDEFFAKGWDETVLNRYYRMTAPLYTTQIFIPVIKADVAPKAFGAGANVKGFRWVIHYKGQVSPPADGRYRFWGSGDDILAIAVDGRMVLLKPWGMLPDKLFPRTNWARTEQSNPHGLPTGTSRLRAGDWMDLKKNEIYDLDILIGECPGNLFDAFVLVEKQGETYEQTKEGPVLPVFQVAPYDTPQARHPRFAKGGTVWRSYQ